MFGTVNFFLLFWYCLCTGIFDIPRRMSTAGMTMHFTSLFLDCVLSVKTEIEIVKPMLWNSNETNGESDGEENERRERDQARTIAIILWLVKHIEKE